MDDGVSPPPVAPSAAEDHAGPMNHPPQGHERARAGFPARTLPTRPPDHVWGGPGAGVECARCGVLLRRDELELEAEFAGEDDRAGVNLHFHVRCYMAWERERVASEAVARISVTANGHEQALPPWPLDPPSGPDRGSR